MGEKFGQISTLFKHLWPSVADCIRLWGNFWLQGLNTHSLFFLVACSWLHSLALFLSKKYLFFFFLLFSCKSAFLGMSWETIALVHIQHRLWSPIKDGKWRSSNMMGMHKTREPKGKNSKINTAHSGGWGTRSTWAQESSLPQRNTETICGTWWHVDVERPLA